MLNEEKVSYMTRLAIFEKNEGKKVFPVNCYFKGDYVGIRMLGSFFGYTLCYVVIFAMWVLYKLDEFLDGTEFALLVEWAKRWGIAYLAGLFIYLVITFIIYSRRYDYASRSQLVYASRLKHLLKAYGRENVKQRREGRRRQS